MNELGIDVKQLVSLFTEKADDSSDEDQVSLKFDPT